MELDALLRAAERRRYLLVCTTSGQQLEHAGRIAYRLVTVRRMLAGLECGGCAGHEELWYTRSDAGLTFTLNFVTAAQPVDSPEAKQRTLARWKDLARYLDVEIANLKKGLEMGYAGENNNVRRVIGQMDGLLKDPIEKTPLFDPALRAKDADFGNELAAVISRGVRPAIKRYRDFLEASYLPKAREQPSVAATPGGTACYRAFLREGTSVTLEPEEIHRMGLEQLQKIEEEIRAVGMRSFGTEDLPALYHQVRTEQKFMYGSDEEVLRCARAAIERAKHEVPRVFGLLPHTDIEVRLTPDGAYYQDSPGAGRPAIFRARSIDPETEPRLDCEIDAFHVGIPGHHLQRAIGHERGSKLHPIVRYYWSMGFSEGWALYAERLADELGLYSEDIYRLGMLSWQAARAVRLVVDTGLHAKGWSREQAIEYMLAHTALQEGLVEEEIDRYIGYPGQATGYMVGMLEIRRLRTQAKTALGPRFDLKQFHDRVLEDGNVTLPMLRAKIERWMDEAR